jgi:exopolysaccharide biosynthesis predicted pyruvyltransferase EpsI
MLRYQSWIGNFLRSTQPLVVLSELPGNVGDYLIWAGTERLMALEKLEFSRVEVSQIPTMPNRAYSNATLIVPGSGALTSKFNEWLPDTVRQASEIFKSVVILPSEYETEVDSVDKALNCQNVFPFARETESYGKLKRYLKAGLSLDPALWAFNFQTVESPRRIDENLGNVLVALRADSASLLGQHSLEPTGTNNDISLTSETLEDFLHSIAAVDTVVSDRLHVVVAATMLGKTVRFIDPFNSKISRYVRYNFGHRFEEDVQERDEKWLLELGYVQSLRAGS